MDGVEFDRFVLTAFISHVLSSLVNIHVPLAETDTLLYFPT